jgi:hypothetical protein
LEDELKCSEEERSVQDAEPDFAVPVGDTELQSEVSLIALLSLKASNVFLLTEPYGPLHPYHPAQGPRHWA